jgi:hypothetical protein
MEVFKKHFQSVFSLCKLSLKQTSILALFALFTVCLSPSNQAKAFFNKNCCCQTQCEEVVQECIEDEVDECSCPNSEDSSVKNEPVKDAIEMPAQNQMQPEEQKTEEVIVPQEPAIEDKVKDEKSPYTESKQIKFYPALW